MLFRRSFLLKYSYILTVLVLCSTMMVYLYQRNFDAGVERLFGDNNDKNITKFLVNTPGCQIPDWDPWDPSTKQFYEPVTQRYNCKGRLSFLRVYPQGIVQFDDTIVRLYYEVVPENISCHYWPIYRNGDVKNFTIDFKYKFGAMKKLKFGVPLQDEFIKTECQLLGTTEPEFVEYLTLTPLKRHVESKKSTRRQNLNKLFNVMFLGIDSTSRLQFQRHFPKCFNYLKDRVSTYAMKGYTKVGDNTFPNLMPMLTGHFYEYYWNTALNKTMYFDDVDFIWKIFDSKGYRTFFAEDAPDIATFNYYRSGFKNPPTDYYYRPFALAVEDCPDTMLSNQRQCIGNKMEMEVIYDYLEKFVTTMNSSRPFFSFTFLARLTHDYLNQAGFADEPTYQLLKYLDEFEVTKNTIIVFFSDHGIRFGPIRKTYIGMFEERMPFMYLIFPKWFSRQYPQIAHNLKTNEERLTTPFDIHATILHLANFTGDIDSMDTTDSKESSESPGLNLFYEVPNYRTCQKASISPHWCTCQTMNLVDINNEVVIKAAVCVVNTINRWTRKFKPKCAVLKLQKIHNARILSAQNRTSNDEDDSSVEQILFPKTEYVDYLIVVSTDPGSSLFEATIKCNSDTENCDVVGDMSRINKYGDQSSCIDDVRVKKYCYCT